MYLKNGRFTPRMVRMEIEPKAYYSHTSRKMIFFSSYVNVLTVRILLYTDHIDSLILYKFPLFDFMSSSSSNGKQCSLYEHLLHILKVKTFLFKHNMVDRHVYTHAVQNKLMSLTNKFTSFNQP